MITLRALTRDLRGLNDVSDGPWDVAIKVYPEHPDGYSLVPADESVAYGAHGHAAGPGDGRKFDAVREARRLLAALRDAGIK